MDARILGWVLLLAAACGGGSVSDVQPATRRDGKPAVTDAATIEVAEPKAGEAFQQPEVEVMESFPVQFAIDLTKEVPTPGHSVEVETVGRPDADRVIVAKLRQRSPKEPSLTVIAHKSVRLPLGSLAAGDYELRIRVREDDAAEDRLVQTIRFTAK